MHASCLYDITSLRCWYSLGVGTTKVVPQKEIVGVLEVFYNLSVLGFH